MFLLVARAQALEFNVDLDLPAEMAEAGLDEAQLEEEMAAKINEKLHVADMGGYLDQMANANVLSSKGMGADYGSDMQRFCVGAAFGTAVNGAGINFDGGEEALPETGFALQIGLMAGLNLGAFSDDDSALRRFKLYVSGMSATTARDPFEGTFFNYGGHLQIKAIKGGSATDPVRWGGLDLTGGYEFSSYELSLSQDMPINADPMEWMATGTYRIGADAQSIPVELSTNFHVLVVTAWAGAGVDYNLSGNAESSISVDGPISVTYDGKTEEAGHASLSLSESGTAASFTPRAFVGLQADIIFLKLYGQLNVTLDESVGGQLGARVVF
ncbi:MAG: hypothetical protein FJ102_13780 [Deltaproteobacteria bacterium]|nr:hypothetical protein [Deltaproteobacteria bacterium]